MVVVGARGIPPFSSESLQFLRELRNGTEWLEPTRLIRTLNFDARAFVVAAGQVLVAPWHLDTVGTAGLGTEVRITTASSVS
jgi:hypothetical protein